MQCVWCVVDFMWQHGTSKFFRNSAKYFLFFPHLEFRINPKDSTTDTQNCHCVFYPALSGWHKWKETTALSGWHKWKETTALSGWHKWKETTALSGWHKWKETRWEITECSIAVCCAGQTGRRNVNMLGMCGTAVWVPLEAHCPTSSCGTVCLSWTMTGQQSIYYDPLRFEFG